jgi:hypothetical protein
MKNPKLFVDNWEIKNIDENDLKILFKIKEAINEKIKFELDIFSEDIFFDDFSSLFNIYGFDEDEKLLEKFKIIYKECKIINNSSK